MKRFLISLSLVYCVLVNGSANCVYGNCSNGYGKVTLSSGGIYEGNFLNQKFEGKGKIIFGDGSKYIGYFHNNMIHGSGKFFYAAGHVYQGEFIQNKKNGFGTIYLANGDNYSGNWALDKMEGFGRYTFKDGSFYKGDFKAGKFEGEGEFTEVNGQTVTGIWKENRIVEKSKEFKKMSGDEATALPGSKIKSNRLVWEDGKSYEGETENGKPHGKGTLTLQNGRKFSGIWMNGKLHSAGEKKENVLTYNAKPNEPKINISTSKSSAGQTKIYALIVGVASYNHMPSLKFTDDDAYRIYSFLKSPEGGALQDDQIEILVDESATLQNINNGIKTLRTKAGENDVVLIYMAGHGVEGHFIPFDFDGRNNTLSYDAMLKNMESCPSKNKIFLLDACHSGSLQARGPLDIQLQEFYNQLQLNPGGTTVISSSKSHETSLESSGIRQGIFSYYLIAGLKGKANVNSDNFVTLGEVFDFVQKNVKTYTGNKQSPTISGTLNVNLPLAMIRR